MPMETRDGGSAPLPCSYAPLPEDAEGASTVGRARRTAGPLCATLLLASAAVLLVVAALAGVRLAGQLPAGGIVVMSGHQTTIDAKPMSTSSRGPESGVSEKTSGATTNDAHGERLGAEAGSNAFPWSNAMLQWQRTGFHFQPEKNWMNDPNVLHHIQNALLTLPRSRAAPPRRTGASPPPFSKTLQRKPPLPPPPPGASQTKPVCRSGGGGVSPRPALRSGWRRSAPAGSTAVARGGGDQVRHAGGGVRRCPAAAARAPDLGPNGLRRAAHAAVLCLLCSVNGILLLGSTRNTRTSGAPALGVVVVAIFFAGGGRPEAGWSDLEIRHLVPAASRGDIVAGENRADGGRWRRSAPLP